MKKLHLIILFFVLSTSALYQLFRLDNIPSVIKTYAGNPSCSNCQPNLEFKPGQVYKIQVQAQHDYFGSIGVKFWNFNRINDDSVIFKIKQTGHSEWLRVSEHKTDQFRNHEFFPFGFPRQTDSKGKTYDIEIIPVNSQPGNAIGFSSAEPFLELTYDYPTTHIFASVNNLANFAAAKLAYLVSQQRIHSVFLIHLILFIAIFAFYLISLRLLPRGLIITRLLPQVAAPFLVVSAAVSVFSYPHELTILLLYSAAIVFSWLRPFSFFLLLRLSLFLLFTAFFSYYFTSNIYTQRVLVWLYLVLLLMLISGYRRATTPPHQP